MSVSQVRDVRKKFEEKKARTKINGYFFFHKIIEFKF